MLVVHRCALKRWQTLFKASLVPIRYTFELVKLTIELISAAHQYHFAAHGELKKGISSLICWLLERLTRPVIPKNSLFWRGIQTVAKTFLYSHQAHMHMTSWWCAEAQWRQDTPVHNNTNIMFICRSRADKCLTNIFDQYSG